MQRFEAAICQAADRCNLLVQSLLDENKRGDTCGVWRALVIAESAFKQGLRVLLVPKLLQKVHILEHVLGLLQEALGQASLEDVPGRRLRMVAVPLYQSSSRIHLHRDTAITKSLRIDSSDSIGHHKESN